MTVADLTEKLSSLPEYIFNRLTEIVQTYEKEASQVTTIFFEYCPKCHFYHPQIIKGGKTKKGKQMYRCKECGSRFTSDFGSFTHHSHISKEQWNECTKLNIQGASLKQIAATIKVSEVTSFRMRHKLMHALEKDEETIVIRDSAELDEKYVEKSHKGTKIDGIWGKRRGKVAEKRGISDEKVCLLTAVERSSNSFLKAYNMAKPSKEEVMNLSSRIESETYIWTDSLASYNALAEELHLTRKILSSKEEYDKVNHLNTVNSFHSLIDSWYAKMRGVASKYINRYASLFNMRWMVRKKEITEALLFINARIVPDRNNHFRVIDCSKFDLFEHEDLKWEA